LNFDLAIERNYQMSRADGAPGVGRDRGLVVAESRKSEECCVFAGGIFPGLLSSRAV
jgi:hypothetical protein